MANPQSQKLNNSLPTYEQQVEHVSSRVRRLELLERLIRSHHFITISFPESGSDQTYITTFMECDVVHGVLKLDGLDTPDGGAPVVNSGTLLKVLARLDGAVLGFQTSVEEVGESDGYPFYRLVFPDIIDHLQRRNAYRVPIDQFCDISVIIEQKDIGICNSTLHDISTTGISIWLAPTTPVLPQLTLIPQCSIQLPDHESMICAVEVRDAKYNGVQNKLLLRARFTGLNRSSRHEIATVVAQLERKMIRYKNIQSHAEG